MDKEKRISFDLDGVIAQPDRWVFRLFNILRLKGSDQAGIDAAEIEYYEGRPLLNHPDTFLAKGDLGFIITSRKPIARAVTKHWLTKHNIFLPVFYSDQKGEINWDGDYKAASIQAAQRKLAVLCALMVDVHFDNNPHIVKFLRTNLTDTAIIQVGGERE